MPQAIEQAVDRLVVDKGLAAPRQQPHQGDIVQMHAKPVGRQRGNREPGNHDGAARQHRPLPTQRRPQHHHAKLRLHDAGQAQQYPHHCPAPEQPAQQRQHAEQVQPSLDLAVVPAAHDRPGQQHRQRRGQPDRRPLHRPRRRQPAQPRQRIPDGERQHHDGCRHHRPGHAVHRILRIPVDAGDVLRQAVEDEAQRRIDELVAGAVIQVFVEIDGALGVEMAERLLDGAPGIAAGIDPQPGRDGPQPIRLTQRPQGQGGQRGKPNHPREQQPDQAVRDCGRLARSLLHRRPPCRESGCVEKR